MDRKHSAKCKSRAFGFTKTAGHKMNPKDLLLSVVAIIEIILIFITATYSWVETISTIIITGDGLIDTYTFTRADIGSSSASIDLSKYFREAGNAHLSAASSVDGKSFIMPITTKTNSVTANYREANINDKNVNYIEYTLRVKVDSSTKFYFDQIPEIKIGGETITDNTVRFAISTGSNNPLIFSNKKVGSRVASGVNARPGGSSGSDTFTVIPNAFIEYSKKSSGTSTKPVFTLPASTDGVDVTIKMWLQDGADNAKYAGKDIIVNKFRLVTDNTATTEVNFVDNTSAFNSSINGYHWVENNNNVVYVYNSATGEKVEMSKSKADPTHWSADVLTTWFTTNKNASLRFYCCTATATLNVNDPKTYLVKWETTPQKAINSLTPDKTDYTYTAYGNVTSASSQTGYGTWGEVIGIELGTEDTSVLPTPSRAMDATHVYVYRPGKSSEKIEMNYGAVGTAGNYWRAYIPKTTSDSDTSVISSVKFQFTSTDGQTYHNYDITAANRYTDQDSSRYIITSASTGYWNPPATVKVQIVCEDTKETGGKVTVSGGKTDATTVKVTAGTLVNITAEDHPEAFADEHYIFKAWYKNDPTCSDSSKIVTTSKTKKNLASPGKNETDTYYAKFVKACKVAVYTVVDEQLVDNTKVAEVKLLDGSGYDPGYSYEFVRYFEKGKKGIRINTQCNDSTHYDYLGWYSSVTGGKIKYQTNEVVFNEQSEFANGIQNDVTMYARYAAKTIVVEVHRYTKGASTSSIDNLYVNGGSISVVYPNGVKTASAAGDYINIPKAPGGVKYGSTVTFIANADTANGYEFVGWYNSKTEFNDTTLVSSNATDNFVLNNDDGCIVKDASGNEYYCIYAYFKIKSYEIKATVSNGKQADATAGTVSYTTTGMPVSSTNTNPTVTATVNFGATVTFSSSPKSGYTFKGWYTKANPNSSDTALSHAKSYAIMANDSCYKQIYAVFTKNESTTKIYFAPRTDYTKMCAFAYNSSDNSKNYLGNWVDNSQGGSVLQNDPNNYATSSLKYISFTTSDEGKFRVIVNDSGNVNKQYPSTKESGLEGTIGKTYFFDEGSPTGLVEIDDSVKYSITFGARSYNGTTALSNYTGGSFTRYGTNYATSDKTFTYYKNQPVNATAVTNDGYDFDKWYSNSALTTSASTTTSLSKTATANATYYAKFTKSKKTVTVTNNHYWSNVYCYAWNATTNENSGWTGYKMTWSYNNGQGQGVYTVDIDAKYDHIIFHNGGSGGTNQTVNIDISSITAPKYWIKDTTTNGNYDVGAW